MNPDTTLFRQKKTLIFSFSLLLLLPLISPVFTAVPYPLQESEYHLQSLGTNPKIETILSMINETSLRMYLENLLDFSPRLTGTHGCEKGAEYIFNTFETSTLFTQYHTWSSFGNRWHPRLFTSQNVEAIHPGTHSDKSIIFEAHYDTVATTPGADDNTGSVAAVLLAAEILSQFEFYHTIKFVCFSGEEEGLLGSHAYARDAYHKEDTIIAALNADMIAHAKSPGAGQKFRMYATQDVSWILNEISQVNIDYGINFELISGIIDEEGSGGSDYFSFVEYGYETIAFFEYEWNKYMHQPEDDINNINFSYLVNTTKLIVGTIARLADMSTVAPQVMFEQPRLGNMYLRNIKIKDIADLKITIFGDLWVWATAQKGNASLTRAEFYFDDKLAFTDSEEPFKWHLNCFSFGKHRLSVVLYDQLGQTAQDDVDVFYVNINPDR